MAGVPDQVPLDIKIQFLENIVILSFGVEPPHENKSARSEWLRNRAGTHYGEHLEDLMLLGNVHDTYERAIQEKDKLIDRERDANIFLS
jgi:hypothetical protein